MQDAMSSTKRKERDKRDDVQVLLNSRETDEGSKSTLGGSRSVAERHVRESQRDKGHRMSMRRPILRKARQRSCIGDAGG
jgi:hypothetical protein